VRLKNSKEVSAIQFKYNNDFYPSDHNIEIFTGEKLNKNKIQQKKNKRNKKKKLLISYLTKNPECVST
jgi:hypothetical protein